MMQSVEMLEAIVMGDQALITALKEQRQQLREAVEMLLNCVDPKRDMQEIRKAHAILRDTRH